MNPKELIEGSWRLDLWLAEGRQWNAPDAHGRFILRDGTVIFMAQRPSPRGTYSRYAYGRYELTETNWSYGYLHDTIIRESEAGTEISHDLPWTGFRSFTIDHGSSSLQLDSQKGNYRLIFEASRFSYFEAERLVRAWTRL